MTTNPVYTDSVKYVGPILASGEKVPAYLTVCPICQDTYVHLVSTTTQNGNDNYETKTGVRGDVFSILFLASAVLNLRSITGFTRELPTFGPM